jgi:hypothetical protein
LTLGIPSCAVPTRGFRRGLWILAVDFE